MTPPDYPEIAPAAADGAGSDMPTRPLWPVTGAMSAGLAIVITLLALPMAAPAPPPGSASGPHGVHRAVPDTARDGTLAAAGPAPMIIPSVPAPSPVRHALAVSARPGVGASPARRRHRDAPAEHRDRDQDGDDGDDGDA